MTRWSDLLGLIAACPAPVRKQFEQELPTVLLPDLGRWASAWAVSARDGKAPRRYA
jgi:hypothetical protein